MKPVDNEGTEEEIDNEVDATEPHGFGGDLCHAAGGEGVVANGNGRWGADGGAGPGGIVSLGGDADGASTMEESTEAGAGRGAGAPREARIAPARTSDISFNGRGKRVSIAKLRHIPALAKVGDALGGDDVAWVTLHDTARIVARLDTGAPLGEQHQRATASFFGKPFSLVRYETSTGGVGWGRVRLVIRSIGRQRRSFVVLQRMRRVEPRTGCVISRFGCVRGERVSGRVMKPTPPWRSSMPAVCITPRT